MTEKQFGKINSVRIGKGGYQDAMFGIWIDMGGKNWGAGTSIGGVWNTEPCSSSKWNEQDRLNEIGVMFNKLRILLMEAGVDSVNDLVSLPVECTFESMRLVGWRILTEVL